MKQFKVIYNIEGDTFDEMVTEYLNDGWNLYGNAWSSIDGENTFLYQSVYREVEFVMVEGEVETEDVEVSE